MKAQRCFGLIDTGLGRKSGNGARAAGQALHQLAQLVRGGVHGLASGVTLRLAILETGKPSTNNPDVARRSSAADGRLMLPSSGPERPESLPEGRSGSPALVGLAPAGV
jgi:hypothetical protein